MADGEVKGEEIAESLKCLSEWDGVTSEIAAQAFAGAAKLIADATSGGSPALLDQDCNGVATMPEENKNAFVTDLMRTADSDNQAHDNKVNMLGMTIQKLGLA